MRSSLLMLLLLTFIIISALPSSISLVKAFPSYEDCAPYTCGNSTIRYPFGTCGELDVNCEANQTILYRLDVNGDFDRWRVVGDITNSSYSTRTLQITPKLMAAFINYYWLFNGGVFNLSEAYMIGTIVNCTQKPADIVVNSWVDCTESNTYCFFYNCESYSVIVPRSKSYNISLDKDLQQLWQTGFQITWSLPHDCHSCLNTGGRCYYSDQYSDLYVDTCICPNGDVHYSYYVIVPRSKSYNISLDKDLQQLWQPGFQITWSVPHDCHSCLNTGGRCYNSDQYSYDTCICRNGDVHYSNCTDGDVLQYGKMWLISAKVMAGIFFAVCVVFSIVVVSCIMVHRQSCCFQRSSSEQQQSIRAFMDPVDSRPPSVENFLNYYSSQAPARYSYSQIITYTNNLAHKVGKGGFGTVYRGKLPNGRLIAVKILDESKQSEQQFIAEVATVGTTSHVNLVRLLGYCSQGSKRALVYEYMVNGSLDKYIHGDHKEKLDWKQLYSIAVCTARGIAYLHEDCRNRILHCDIKPHNVLLDLNFLPKVADFGLAKISDREETHISVANRGTLGYAAPEMWSRMYGTVTDRSDVYSYGMLVMEMVGGRKNIDFDNKESTSSKLFYAEWAFKQVEKGQFENLRKGNMSEEDQGIVKKLSLVGLWCIQFNASRRPSMNKVVQMLEGDVDITTPPCPFPTDMPDMPWQGSSSNQSSSTYALEIQMANPASRDQTAGTTKECNTQPSIAENST